MEMPCNPSCFRARTTKTAQSCDPISTRGERDDQHAMSASIFVKSAPRPTLYTLLIKLVITKPSPLSTLLKVAQSPLLFRHRYDIQRTFWMAGCGGGGGCRSIYTYTHKDRDDILLQKWKNPRFSIVHNLSRLTKVLQ